MKIKDKIKKIYPWKKRTGFFVTFEKFPNTAYGVVNAPFKEGDEVEIEIVQQQNGKYLVTGYQNLKGVKEVEPLPQQDIYVLYLDIQSHINELELQKAKLLKRFLNEVKEK